MQADPKPRRGLLKKLLVLFVSFLVAGLVGELFVRVMVGAPLAERLPISEIEAHPTRGWRMVPGYDHFTYHHRVRVNSLGLRGGPVGTKSDGIVRILALGDSLVYGQGVAEEDTLPALLQAKLEERGHAVEVINGGHRAYDTNQELAQLEELAPLLEPDVVVLFWYWNDLLERDVQRSFERYSRTGPVAFDTSSRMDEAASARWKRKQWARRSALAMYLWDTIGPRKPGDTPDPARLEQGLERLPAHFVRLRELADAHGFRVVFAPIPDRRTFTGTHEAAKLTERALELAREAGFETHELFGGLQETVRELGHVPLVPFDGHYAGPANAAMAEVLAASLLQ